MFTVFGRCVADQRLKLLCRAGLCNVILDIRQVTFYSVDKNPVKRLSDRICEVHLFI